MERDGTAMTGNDPRTIAAAQARAPTMEAAPQIAATAQRILRSDLTLPCRIGVTEEERAQRQRLRFNIQLEIRAIIPRSADNDP